jgi:site-specific recombinase XerD
MNSFIGWLVLPNTAEGARAYILEHKTTKKPLTEEQITGLVPKFLGRGIGLDRVTPALLIDPELIGEFLAWRTLRGGGESGTHTKYMMYFLSLTRPVTGFLAQSPEFVCDLLGLERTSITGPANRDAYLEAMSQWQPKCTELHDVLQDMREEFDKDAKTRNPEDDLAPILDLPDPMGLIIQIITMHGRERPVGELSTDQGENQTRLATWYRNNFLVRLIASNPLRVSNLSNMTWRSDNTGNLYRRGSGWRIRFDKVEFKNEKGAARNSRYDVPVSSSLTSFVDTYIHRARPKLLRDRPDPGNVWLTNRGTAVSPKDLSNILDDMAQRYLPGTGVEVPALRAHAFRHIVATAWLRAHPGQFRLVAHLLHDTLHTVLANYDKTKPADGVQAWDDWLSGRMPAPRL